VLGARVLRKEDPRLVTGTGSFTADIKLPGMVYVRFVRSPYAHAKIKSIDTSKAKALKGVVAVFTAKDVKLNPVPTAWTIPNADLKIPKYYPLAVDKVRYVGDPVAVVVAEDPYTARDAAELVEVEYEPLPAVVEQEEAVKPGAPQLYDEVPNNVAFTWRLSGGNVDAAFASADVVVKHKFVNQRLQPTAMETRAVVAEYNASTDSYTVWITSQNPHVHRLLFSAILGVPEHKLRVIAPDVGGGFGSKITVYGDEALVVYLSKLVRKPVYWWEERSENYHSSTHGRDHVEYVELAAKSDGTITGLRVKVYANLGAYLSTAAPGVPTYLFALMLSGCYKIPNIQAEVVGVLTNTSPVDAYRGAGRPEASYLLERMVDLLSRRLGKDPVEIRLKNFIQKDEMPYTVATGLTYDSGDYAAALKKALEIVGYEKLREEQKRRRNVEKLLGIGISSYIEVCGLGPSKAVRGTGFGLGLWESATVRMHPSGKVSVYTGSSPHGQGEETTFAQIVSYELGVPVEDVEIIHGDTAMIPFGMGTYGSRTTPVGGGAIALACRELVAKGAKIAAHLLDTRVENVVFDAGRGAYLVRDNPQRSVSIQEVAIASYQADRLPPGVEPGFEATKFYDPENFVFPYGTHICVVEVDAQTGQVEIKRYVAVDDCGVHINPMLVEGQVHGGVVQGLGQAMLEHSVYDKSGTLITASLNEYAIPTSVESPKIESHFIYTPSPHNPLGVKGVGETGTIASAQAYVNAVVDALSHLGVQDIQMPLTPERVWRAIHRS